MRALVNFHMKNYFKSNKFVFPLIFLVCYLGFAYSIIPYHVLSSFGMTACAVYLVMIWAGYNFCAAEEEAIGQILLLKARSYSRVWASKMVCMVWLALAAALIAMGYPLITGLINHSKIFIRPVTIADVGAGLLVQFLFGLTGGMLGLVFNGQVKRSRKFVLVLIPIFGLMGLIRDVVQEKYGWTKLITWLFPPLYHTITYMNKNEYPGTALLLPLISLLIYLAAEAVIYLLESHYSSY